MNTRKLKSMEEKWIHNLRKKMESHNEPEPMGLWDDIATELNKKKPTYLHRNYKKIILWGLPTSGVAALVILFLFSKNPVTLHNLEELNIIPTAINQKERLLTKPYNKTRGTLKNTLAYHKVISANKKQANANEKSFLISANTQSYAENERPKSSNDNYLQDTIITNQTTTSGKNKIEKPASIDRKNNKLKGEESKHKSLYRNKNTFSNRGELVVSLYNSTLSKTSEENSGYGELIQGATLINPIRGNEVTEFGYVENIIFSNIEKTSQTKREHKQPIKTGISIRYQLNEKISIESGLTYSYLSSTLFAGTEQSFYKTEQSLQYIGIPLKFNYDIWKNKRWNLYVSTGSLTEKCISGNYHTDYVLDYKLVAKESKKIKEDELQWSINGSLGVQANLLDNVALFAEPGLSYYFDNKSNIETIYKTKPLNFNFMVGLRFNLN